MSAPWHWFVECPLVEVEPHSPGVPSAKPPGVEGGRLPTRSDQSGFGIRMPTQGLQDVEGAGSPPPFRESTDSGVVSQPPAWRVACRVTGRVLPLQSFKLSALPAGRTTALRAFGGPLAKVHAQ